MTSPRINYVKATPQQVEQFIREYYSNSYFTQVSATEPIEGLMYIINLTDCLEEDFSFRWGEITLTPSKDKSAIFRVLDLESIRKSFEDRDIREGVILGHNEALNDLYKKILEHFNQPDEKQAVKPEKPAKPRQGSSVDIWLDYYHAMKEAGYKMTFPMLEKESGYRYSTFKQAHGIYKLNRENSQND